VRAPKGQYTRGL